MTNPFKYPSIVKCVILNPQVAPDQQNWTSGRIRLWTRRKIDPFSYLQSYLPPGEHPAGKWTLMEHYRFISALKIVQQVRKKERFASLSLLMPGRTIVDVKRYFNKAGRAGFIYENGNVKKKLRNKARIRNVNATPIFLRRNLSKFLKGPFPNVSDYPIREYGHQQHTTKTTHHHKEHLLNVQQVDMLTYIPPNQSQYATHIAVKSNPKSSINELSVKVKHDIENSCKSSSFKPYLNKDDQSSTHQVSNPSKKRVRFNDKVKIIHNKKPKLCSSPSTSKTRVDRLQVAKQPQYVPQPSPPQAQRLSNSRRISAPKPTLVRKHNQTLGYAPYQHVSSPLSPRLDQTHEDVDEELSLDSSYQILSPVSTIPSEYSDDTISVGSSLQTKFDQQRKPCLPTLRQQPNAFLKTPYAFEDSTNVNQDENEYCCTKCELMSKHTKHNPMVELVADETATRPDLNWHLPKSCAAWLRAFAKVHWNAKFSFEFIENLETYCSRIRNETNVVYRQLTRFEQAYRNSGNLNVSQIERQRLVMEFEKKRRLFVETEDVPIRITNRIGFVQQEKPTNGIICKSAEEAFAFKYIEDNKDITLDEIVRRLRERWCDVELDFSERLNELRCRQKL